MTTEQQTRNTSPVDRIKRELGRRNIVLVGMMGAGKSSVGKRLAAALDMPFVDADQEIEAAANMTIPEIFETYGEQHFRDGEKKVIARLLRDGPKVVATGGGAIMDSETRTRIGRRGVSVWLKADIQILMDRVKRRSNRPLLSDKNPESVLRRLLRERQPFYASADITITSRNTPHQTIIEEIIEQLDRSLAGDAAPERDSVEQSQ